MSGQPERRTTVVIDGDTFERLSDLGRQNDRSASAEARLAIRRHLETAERVKANRERVTV
jgi:hypothetical protein